jgi:hypothetical protein
MTQAPRPDCTAPGRRATRAQPAEIAWAVHPRPRLVARRRRLGSLQIDEHAIRVTKPKSARRALARRINKADAAGLEP